MRMRATKKQTGKKIFSKQLMERNDNNMNRLFAFIFILYRLTEHIKDC